MRELLTQGGSRRQWRDLIRTKDQAREASQLHVVAHAPAGGGRPVHFRRCPTYMCAVAREVLARRRVVTSLSAAAPCTCKPRGRGLERLLCRGCPVQGASATNGPSAHRGQKEEKRG